MSPAVAAALPYLLIPFVLWRVYARVKRLMTRQRSHAWRHWLSVVLFGMLVAMLGALSALTNQVALAGLAAGVAAGAGLGVAALKRTSYEQVDGALYYTPSAHIGVFVSLLFIGRLLWRMIQVWSQHGAQPPENMANSPLTLLVFGILAGYYVVYSGGLLRWRHAHGVK